MIYFSAFSSLVGSKAMTEEDVRPALDKMKDHLICEFILDTIMGSGADFYHKILAA